MVKYTGRGLVVKRPGVLSQVQMLNLVLGVGVFSLLPKIFGLEVLQGGFGVTFFILARRILGKLPTSFSANVDGDFFPRICRPCQRKTRGVENSGEENFRKHTIKQLPESVLEPPHL